MTTCFITVVSLDRYAVRARPTEAERVPYRNPKQLARCGSLNQTAGKERSLEPGIMLYLDVHSTAFYLNSGHCDEACGDTIMRTIEWRHASSTLSV